MAAGYHARFDILCLQDELAFLLSLHGCVLGMYTDYMSFPISSRGKIVEEIVEEDVVIDKFWTAVY